MQIFTSNAFSVCLEWHFKEKKKVYQSLTLSSIHMNTNKQISKDYDKAVSDRHDKIEDNVYTNSNPAKFYR